MGPLVITGLALGLVVSVGGMLYPFWPFGRRWRAMIAAAAVLATYAVAVPSVSATADDTVDAIASSTPIATTSSLMR